MGRAEFRARLGLSVRRWAPVGDWRSHGGGAPVGSSTDARIDFAQPSGRPRHLSMAIPDRADSAPEALRHVHRRGNRAFRADADRLWRDVGRSTIAQSVVRGVCYTVGMKRRHAHHHVRLLGPLWLVLVVAVGWMPWGSKDRATSDPLPDQPSPSQLQPLRRRQTSSGVVPRQRSSTACNFDGPGRLLARAA